MPDATVSPSPPSETTAPTALQRRRCRPDRTRMWSTEGEGMPLALPRQHRRRRDAVVVAEHSVTPEADDEPAAPQR